MTIAKEFFSLKSELTKKMTRNVSAMQARQKFGELLDRAKLRGERFMIKRSGKPIAVIMSINDYEDMEDLLDTLMEEADKDFQKALLESRREYEAGEVGSESELWDALK